MRGSNNQQRRQADAIVENLIDFLKGMPENEARWSILLARTGLHDTQLDRGLKRLMRLSVVETRLIWIAGHRLVVYHLRNPSSKVKLFTEKRSEPDKRTRQVTRRKGFQTVRDYGTWRHVSRIDQSPDFGLQEIFEEVEEEANTL